MQDFLLQARPQNTVPIIPVAHNSFGHWLAQQQEPLRRWVKSTGFRAKPGSICLIPGDNNVLATVLTGIKAADDPWACSALPAALPEGSYYIDADWEPVLMERIAVGWGLGAYQFNRYKESKQPTASLVLNPACDARHVKRQVQAITLVRDLINTPAEDMMPLQLADAMLDLGQAFNAKVQQIVGDELLENKLPLIHAVGRASVHAPRLLELNWGDQAHPKLTLVGKGVCFDSGGLDLKPANGMRLMKKDMGGAAHALGLAYLVMSAGLPIRLRVLVAAVENAVAGNALRPGDVIRSRQGLSVEIHNTDAEGRLILGDALTEAGAEQPDLLLDFATLTGAARVALGTKVPALFCNTDALAEALLQASRTEQDPIWRLPLHKPYREMLDSKIADLSNASNSSFAGAITAALFLQEFVPRGVPWAHFDLMGWNAQGSPGRPEGGEAMGLRAVFQYLRQRFGG